MKNTFDSLFCLFFFLLSINISFGQEQNVHTHYFENIFLGGQIIVDNVLEPNSTTITAENPYIPSGSSISYNFVWWTDNESSTNPRIVTPTNNQTYQQQ